jgi:ribonuclease HI
VAEIIVALIAIEIAHRNSWGNLWLETDSKLTMMAFQNAALVPWSLRNKWINCQEMLKGMRFIVSHIYREGNPCADSLANVGLSTSSFVWWQDAPDIIRKGVISIRWECPTFVLFPFD